MELLIATKEDLTSLQDRIALAQKLGHKKIAVLLSKETISYKDDLKDVECLLLAKTVGEVQKLAKQCDAVIALAKREFFENKTVKYILTPEDSSREDFVHHRNSGLNQVLLNLCKRSGKEIITTLSLLEKKKHIMLGRMMQNAHFCKKYNVLYHITSGAISEWDQRSASDMLALKRELEKY